MELPSWTARQEVELEPIEILVSRQTFPRRFSDFRCVFFSGLRPSNMLNNT